MKTIVPTSVITARQAAVDLHRQLLAGSSMQATPRPLPQGDLLPEPGEVALGVFGPGEIDRFARWNSATVVYPQRAGVAFGDPSFVAGWTLGTLVFNALDRKRALHQAAPQSRHARLGTTVLTSRRLWCQVVRDDGRIALRRFNYDTIIGLESGEDDLVLRFQQSEPLLLAGPWALWCAVVIAHFSPAVDATRIPRAPHITLAS
ncbi:hypothetical protein [Saccharothrix sp. ALI-22-I]|uniref:hypothetical protein n=1 Tax=Saccharothrix sp. ALI-22-I TaxID=1933778 RepID=UPI00097C4BF2|nr:hypothetical protein [Saccharothrix sp. ALI-22-I]